MLAGVSLYKRVRFWKELPETQIAQIKKSQGSGRLYALSNVINVYVLKKVGESEYVR